MNKFIGLLAVLFIITITACGGSEEMAPMPLPSCPPPIVSAPPPPPSSEVCESGATRPCSMYCAFTRDYSLAGQVTCQNGSWSGSCRPNETAQLRCRPLDESPSRMIVDLDHEATSFGNTVVIASEPHSSVDRGSLAGIVVNDAGQGTLDYMSFEGKALLIQDGSARPVALSDVVTSCGLYQNATQIARALVSGSDIVFNYAGLVVADRYRPLTRFHLRCDYRLSPTLGLRHGGWIEVRIGARTDGFRTRESNGSVQGTLVLQQNSTEIGDTLITVVTNDR